MLSGSSPLARGLPTITVSVTLGYRIIPARAGFTSFPSGSQRNGPGSSPLARGLPSQFHTVNRQNGIIPARAGFTRILPLHRLFPRDHPRSRGVYTRRPLQDMLFDGSSPLARGLRRRRLRCR